MGLAAENTARREQALPAVRRMRLAVRAAAQRGERFSFDAIHAMTQLALAVDNPSQAMAHQAEAARAVIPSDEQARVNALLASENIPTGG